MKVGLVYPARFPVIDYGGTERVVWWLGKGLAELGHEVFLHCLEGSVCPFAKVIPTDFSKTIRNPSVEIYHFFLTPDSPPDKAFIVTIGGNGKVGETFPINTVFISQNHAQRHGADAWVYNGLDPSEYEYSESKSDYLCFLAKASWNVKNVKGAIRLSKKSRRPLKIMGGKKWFFNRRGLISWEGMVGREIKAKTLKSAAGLLFPVIWNEPFGLAVIEALVSGTPVLASRRGSLPELLTPETGRICDSEDEFMEGITNLGKFSSEACREHVLQNFHYRKMAEDYLTLYGQVLGGNTLNTSVPKGMEAPTQLLPLIPLSH